VRFSYSSSLIPLNNDEIRSTRSNSLGYLHTVG
jgi:hypothetical protein